MDKRVYRNMFYIKECIASFFSINKKYLFVSLLFVVLGLSIGICIGFSNFNNFTFVNFSDKLILNLFCGENGFWYFFVQILEYIFITTLILLLCNFSYITFLVYPIFAYLSLKVITNCIIFWAMLKVAGIIFSVFYFLIKLSIIVMFIVIFMICRNSSKCNCSNSKFSSYPYKSIGLCFGIIMLFVSIMLILTLIFSKFVVIKLKI